jgi:hypothetical protein
MSEASASSSEAQILSSFNNALTPRELVLSQQLAGFWLTPATARRILEKRAELGAFSSLSQVLDIEGVDPRTLNEARSALEPRPARQWKSTDADVAALRELFEKLPRQEQKRFREYYPWFTPEDFALRYDERITDCLNDSLVFSDAGVIVVGGATEALIWREFWKRLLLWLAELGLEVTGLAATDGPLPIMKVVAILVAIGASIWLIMDLYSNWERWWSEARMAVENKDLYKGAMGMVDTIEEHLGSTKFCKYTDPKNTTFIYYVGEIISKIIDMYKDIVRMRPGTLHDEALAKAKDFLRRLRESFKAKAPNDIQWLENLIKSKFDEAKIPD